MNARKRTFEILDCAKDGDKVSKAFDIFIIVLIVLNVIALMLDSFSDLPDLVQKVLKNFELFSIIIFTVEYFLRLWTAKYQYPNSKVPVIRYIFSFMAIIDLLAILPFYIPLTVSVDLRFLRILRLFRRR